ncbi:Structural maintenance of chromosomes protein 3 [Podila epigama]|nr:Structural maintenance of chromosomes protein 3 [Podila epigama]
MDVDSEAMPSCDDIKDVPMDSDLKTDTDTDAKASNTSTSATTTTTRTKAGKRAVAKTKAISNRNRAKPFSRIQISHAASLPQIVWVFDEKYRWWPGKIVVYPPKGNIAKVSRFGNIKPKSISVDCSEDNILPFWHASKTSHQEQGKQSQFAKVFEEAYRAAYDAQLKDDDGLPDDILTLISSAPPMPAPSANSTSANSKSTSSMSAISTSAKLQHSHGSIPLPDRRPIAPDKLPKTSSTFFPDSSLSIPGELVLAQMEKLYYPGKITTFNNKTNKYKILFATGNEQSVERKKFYTRYEKGFLTCVLGELEQPKLDPNYENKELKSLLSNVFTSLHAIVAGAHDEAGRVKLFKEGGKARRTLAQRVSPGRFNRQEYTFINHLIQDEFIPSLKTSASRTTTKPGERDEPLAKRGAVTELYSDQMRLRFVTDVLLPEAITRLTMAIESVPYAEADEKVQHGRVFYSDSKVKAERVLNSLQVDPNIQQVAQSDGQVPGSPSDNNLARAVVLYDFLDQDSLDRLRQESGERTHRIQATTLRLQAIVDMLTEQRTEFKQYLANAITLDDSALTFVREKMQLQEHQTTTMAESLMSLANHYDQVAQVLAADIQPTEEELEVLESDTNEVSVIIEELQESLALVKATTEEIGVREHLYATAYHEAIALFGKIDQLEPQLAELVSVIRAAEGLGRDFDATEKLIGEINSLAIWYEEFYNSYEALTAEILRRHQVHQAQQRLVHDFLDKMESSYTEEMRRRAMFSERHGKFLPVDVCPSFADPPIQYEVQTHGEWRLPMPSRATLQLIIIQGFKSYKDQTITEPFSGKHNVIVGRNGSGKSNFFAAIRFVLSDAYTNMGREERQSLLHEGSGAATMSAYVEIIFDNSDNRFPNGKDELTMRRTIGLKKDEYSLDKKSATKSDVVNMLESAGFSRSNPYYIVPQGRITSLTNAKDNERLQLLKEVAGTRVYEQRRQESLKIIGETDSKRRNIEELLRHIEERLEELEEEKEELKLYQELDRRRRCLEYTIYSREQKDINDALEEMEEEHRQSLQGSNQQQKGVLDIEARISALEQEINEQKQKVDVLLSEKRQLGEELESQIKVKAQIELRIKDYEDNADQSAETKRKNFQDLQKTEQEIQAKEQELAAVVPEYQRLEGMERRLQGELEQVDLNRQTLYSKQGRSGQFKSKEHRDEWIRKEMSEIQQSYTAQESQATLLANDVASLKLQLAEVTQKIQGVREREQQRRNDSEALVGEMATLRSERDSLTEKRKELWREDAKMDSTLNHLREELRASERSLGASMDKNTSAGLTAVTRIAKTLNLDGVYGPLYELFDVDDVYDVAVNVTAGASLFHVVVDSDSTATRVLEALNKEKAGRVTFMPLNRLNPTPSTYPEANDAIPMIKQLRFDPKYTKAFEQVFGRALICQTLEIAATYSKSYNLNGITLEGDKVDRKGALTGGYQDTRNSRLNSVKNIKSFAAKHEAAMERCQAVKQEIAALDQKITGLLNQIQLLDVRKKQLADSRETLVLEYRSLVKDETVLKESLEAKEKSQMDILADLKIQQAQLEALGSELKSEMVQTLSEAEHRLLSELITKSDELKERLSVLSKERYRLGTRKNILEITLNSNLRPCLEELRSKVENSVALNDGALDKRRRDYAIIVRAIDEISSRLQAIDDELEEFSKNVASNEESLEKLQSNQMEALRTMGRSQKDAERYVSRRNLLLRKKEDCTKNIRDLGVLPEEAFEKYSVKATQKLLKQLHKVNEELKKYSHVNKKAFEQYSNFTKQRDTLNQRKEELDVSEAAIRELIQTLDQRKDEAIERTFKQVAKNFSEVFLKLVPAGRGKLIMQRKMDQTQDMDDDDDGHEASAIDNYTGIAIQVSFNSKMNEGLRMQQLSGGQKSLVALTLIFAIQQCDPAPFYLFDEIDANLDAAHRTAVASMIHSLSDQAQFITTTFRPEMLANADKFYGVTFQNKVSVVNAITKEEALDFVEQEQAH